MDATQKGIESLKNEIKAEVRGIFKMNMKFEDWNVPEADDKKAAEAIISIMQETLDELKQEIKEGKYDNY
jgi:ABC-type Zn uptake system ZnuABC Zn-binding protein ZnuA